MNPHLFLWTMALAPFLGTALAVYLDNAWWFLLWFCWIVFL